MSNVSCCDGPPVNVFGERRGWTAEESRAKTGEIYQTLLRIFDLAEGESIPTNEAADTLALRRIEDSRTLQNS